MKGWTKRRIALILALALLASQMSACKKETGPAGNNAVENNNPAISVDKDAQKPEETKPVAAEAPGVLEWLQENLENIHQSLLEGDYAKVIEQLLGVQDSLANNAHFNALLYIAYMGNGEESKAAALLANVDPSEFADAFLESAEALKGNADIEAIKRKLMDSMMELSQTNPAGFAAVAKIGANIQNSNPNDPTIYAARYIAALAMGDQAAIDAILAEAKAHGVTAETLSTATVEYIETHNVTSVSVYDAERGITTSTVYNAQGQATKTKIVITREDGSQEFMILDGWGNPVAWVVTDKDGNLLRRVECFDGMTVDENGHLASIQGGYGELLFKDGKPVQICNYSADGQKNIYYVLNEAGEITAGYRIVDGQEQPIPTEELKYAYIELDEEGNVIKATSPLYDENGNHTGMRVVTYDYTVNAFGLLKVVEEYDEQGALQMSMENFYAYDLDKTGKLVKRTSDLYSEDGQSERRVIIDYENKKAITENGIRYAETVLEVFGDDLRIVALVGYVCETNENGEAVPGRMLDRTVITYCDNGDIKQTTTSYDDQGRVTEQWELTNDCATDRVKYQYRDDGTILKAEYTYAPGTERLENPTEVKIYEISGDQAVLAQIHSYEYEGDRKIETVYRADGETVRSKVEYVLNSENKYQETSRVDYYYTYKTDGSYTVEEKTYENEKLTQVKITEYDDKGRPTSEEVCDGNDICISLTLYKYENGKVTKITGRDFDEDGNPQSLDITTLDEDGRPVQTVTKDANGNLVSVTDYEYNENGTVIKKTCRDYNEDGIPQTQEITALDKDGRPVQTQIGDAEGNLVSDTYYAYNEDGTVTTTTYGDFDEDGNPQIVEITSMDKNGREIYTDTYDADLNLVSQTDYYYDENNNLEYKETVDANTRNTIEETYYAYDSESGALSEEKTIEYEADGDTVKSKVYIEYAADGETVVYKEEAEYVDGELVKITVEEDNQRMEQTFEDGLDGDIYIYNKVDDQWILDTISTPVYDGEDIVGKVDKSVDENGNVNSEVEYVFDENGDDVPVRETKYTYEDGNVTQTVETSYSYNEDGTLEGTTENTYDADGNLVDTKYFDADGNEIEKPEDLELAAEGTGEDSLNPAPEEPEETEEPEESEDGEDPTLPGIPEIPGLPDISDIPGLPDISDIPGLPDISDIPGLPDISDIPGLPDISDIPGLPDISDIPGLPDISDIPGLPDISEIPGLPDISDVPGMSEFLENMDYGQIAEYVESLKDYEHPEDVEVPDFREYFENTEDPGFLKVAEAVDRIQHPEEPQEPETVQETEASEEETSEAPTEAEVAPVEAEKPETPELPKAPEEAKKPEEPEEPDAPEEPDVPAGE